MYLYYIVLLFLDMTMLYRPEPEGLPTIEDCGSIINPHGHNVAAPRLMSPDLEVEEEEKEERNEVAALLQSYTIDVRRLIALPKIIHVLID